MLFAIVYPPQDSFVSPKNMVFGCLWMPRDMNSGGGAAFVVLKTTSMVPTLVKTASFLGSSTTNVEPLDQG